MNNTTAERLKIYGQLMRADKPIGTMLLLGHCGLRHKACRT